MPEITARKAGQVRARVRSELANQKKGNRDAENLKQFIASLGMIRNPTKVTITDEQMGEPESHN